MKLSERRVHRCVFRINLNRPFKQTPRGVERRTIESMEHLTAAKEVFIALDSRFGTSERFPLLRRRIHERRRDSLLSGPASEHIIEPVIEALIPSMESVGDITSCYHAQSVAKAADAAGERGGDPRRAPSPGRRRGGRN
jgi:hypothetical protein